MLERLDPERLCSRSGLAQTAAEDCDWFAEQKSLAMVGITTVNVIQISRKTARPESSYLVRTKCR